MRIRTFIAVEVDEEIREAAGRLTEELARDVPGVKWVDPSNMHLTLKFLGDIDSPEVVRVCDEASAATAQVEPFEIGFEGVGAFPAGGAPRVFWIGVTGQIEPLAVLHADLDERLGAMGAGREHKRFVPHLTIGRSRRRIDPHRIRERLDGLASWIGGTQVVEELTVFSSELTRSGPIHTPMGRSPLAKK